MRFLLLLCLLPYLAFANHNSSKINRILYVTLDGVRWQDFYNENFFQNLRNKYGAHANYYGVPAKPMQTASVPISLPSYQSQMSGAVQACANNSCGRIMVETFPEKLLLTRHLRTKDVVVFSSWSPIEFAAEHIPETIFTNTGNTPVYDPEDHTADPVMAELNQMQSQDPHPNNNRRDQYTWAQAVHYFDKHKPMFMWISLVNADDAAHAGDLLQYHRMLKFYDSALVGILDYLQEHQLLSDTLVIITTDHGRGNGLDWERHGPNYPESKQIWAFVLNGELTPDVTLPNQPFYSTLSIRPTFEKIFYK